MHNINKEAPIPTSDPTLTVVATSLQIFCKQFRNSTPLPGASENADEISLLLSDKGPEPDEIFPLLTALGSQIFEDVLQSASLPALTCKTWVKRHRALIANASSSFCEFYALHVEELRMQAPNFKIHKDRRLAPKCVFEAAAVAWIFESQHDILKGMSAMFLGAMLTVCSEEPARNFNKELLQNIRQLHAAGSALKKQIETLITHTGSDLPFFDEIKNSVDLMLLQIAPIIDDIGTTGRPPEPLKPILAKVLHTAGLTNKDIGGILGTGIDAVRKQRARRRRDLD